MKLAYQYQVERGQPERVWFISRDLSYHGCTLYALSLSGHKARRERFERILAKNVVHVSACDPYFNRKEGMSDDDYVKDKAKELEEVFQRLGPGNVAAFYAEPIVGAVSQPFSFAFSPQGWPMYDCRFMLHNPSPACM